jgi:hypothetical protein
MSLRLCYDFDDALIEICSDLFGAKFCPKKINFFNKGCMYPNVRYILTYEDNEKGYSFKLWSLFNQRCDLYTAYVKYYPIGGNMLVFPDGMFVTATANWLFSSSFHRACKDLKKDNRLIVLDILIKTGVLLPTVLIQVQKDLFNPDLLKMCYLDGNNMVLS